MELLVSKFLYMLVFTDKFISLQICVLRTLTRNMVPITGRATSFLEIFKTPSQSKLNPILFFLCLQGQPELCGSYHILPGYQCSICFSWSSASDDLFISSCSFLVLLLALSFLRLILSLSFLCSSVSEAPSALSFYFLSLYIFCPAIF